MSLAATAVFLCLSASGGHASDMETDEAPHAIFVETDAHEGPVVVPSQNRLYFTTVPDFSSDDTFIAIRYVDLATGEVATLRPRSNMANGMWLTKDGSALLVAEQGTMDTPGGISRIRLSDGHREVLVDSFEGKRFSSPNKVIEASNGWIYFSDPDYGHNQGFKPAPELPMAVYAFNPQTGETFRLTTEVARPHGLALSPDETLLYIGDTDAIDGLNPYDPNRSKDILSAPLLAPDKIGPLTKVLSVPVGIPDGFIVTEDGNLWVAAGDGLRQYAANGELIEHYPVEGGVFNVTRHGDDLYHTANTAIWRTDVEHLIDDD
jgi:gluconolactonase